MQRAYVRSGSINALMARRLSIVRPPSAGVRATIRPGPGADGEAVTNDSDPDGKVSRLPLACVTRALARTRTSSSLTLRGLRCAPSPQAEGRGRLGARCLRLRDRPDLLQQTEDISSEPEFLDLFPRTVHHVHALDRHLLAGRWNTLEGPGVGSYHAVPIGRRVPFHDQIVDREARIRKALQKGVHPQQEAASVHRLRPEPVPDAVRSAQRHRAVEIVIDRK